MVYNISVLKQETKTGKDREQDREIIIEECGKMSKAYPNATYPLEVMGNIYLGDAISDGEYIWVHLGESSLFLY